MHRFFMEQLSLFLLVKLICLLFALPYIYKKHSLILRDISLSVHIFSILLCSMLSPCSSLPSPSCSSLSQLYSPVLHPASLFFHPLSPPLSLPPHPHSSGVLWLHTIFSLLYLVVTGIFTIHYSLQLGKHQQDCVRPYGKGLIKILPF